MRRKTFLLLTSIIVLSLPSVCIAQVNTKLEYGILIDNTGSMRSQFDTAREIGKAVVRQIHDHGSVALFDFHSQGSGPGSRAIPIARTEATQDEQSLNRAIDGLYVEGGQTSLLDAIKFIGDSLNSKPGTNKIIILITDGEDRVSEIEQRTLLKFLKDQRFSVFAVGMIQQLDSERGLIRSSPRDRATALLTSLAKETGGRVAFPKLKKLDIQNLLSELSLPIE